MTDKHKMREEFEQWYVENAFDYPSDPIGSRDCGLQWESWQAAKESDRKELEAAKQKNIELKAMWDKMRALAEGAQADCAKLRTEKEALEKELAEANSHLFTALGNEMTWRHKAEELPNLLAAAEQRGYDRCIDFHNTITGHAECVGDVLAAARQQGFEEGKQAGRDELRKEYSEQEPVAHLMDEDGYAMPVIWQSLPPRVKGE